MYEDPLFQETEAEEPTLLETIEEEAAGTDFEATDFEEYGEAESSEYPEYSEQVEYAEDSEYAESPEAIEYAEAPTGVRRPPPPAVRRPPGRPSPPRQAPGAGVPTINVPGTTIIVRPVKVLDGFCFNESSLMERHLREIAVLARQMVNLARDGRPVSARVVGHTDNVGGAAFNQALGLRRAKAVGNKLRRFTAPLLNQLQRSGVRVGRLQIVEQSLGERRPRAPGSNGTEQGRAKNRRVEVFFSRI